MLAEQFSVTWRTVSRWETGSNLSDLDLLLKDFTREESEKLTRRLHGAFLMGLVCFGINFALGARIYAHRRRSSSGELRLDWPCL